ncbi:MAG: TIGR04283 family arsenosugar biosynthesis glycosyltransferase [candidate division NC10 bacterium]|nr:TIGR04283 family arsenosugar biosynthesis glycosyltransferase [candidate division NC10 bacterium]
MEGLIVFTRYPQPGKVKTRLIPSLGAEGAAELHHWMAIRTLTQARRLSREASVSLEVRFEGASEALMREWLGPDLTHLAQGEGDLGRRLGRAFQEAFAAGRPRVVIIGTDCPELSWRRIDRAFAELAHHDLVLGPAKDGGYYLIGLRRAASSSRMSDLFSDISWSTDQVLKQTMERAKGMGLSFNLLEPLSDVDRPEDLALWQPGTGVPPPAYLSIIIPARNEGQEIGPTLDAAAHGSHLEILVVDGESEDQTAEIARSRGATVLSCPPGRARQMNQGAALANGDVYLFLHADTHLPAGFDAQIRQALAKPRLPGGAFSLRIDAPWPSLRAIEHLANWRSRWLQLPYGDQAIFVRSDVFWELGGVPEMPIMEDFELARRMKRRGPISILSEPVLTSARRWRALGVARTTLINQMVIIAYHLGIPPGRIARWYRRNQKA